jgi:hypothetical protein
VALQIKLDEEKKKKHIVLAQQNGFCPTLLPNPNSFAQHFCTVC